MNEERRKVLEMLESGAISAEEAARLMDCLGEETAASKETPHADGSAEAGGASERMQGKKLRVCVKGTMENDKKINVDVSIPLILARFADDIIMNCVPQAANDELKKNGIDLRALNIGKIVDTFETLEDDIVDADIDDEETKLKVRVYVG